MADGSFLMLLLAKDERDKTRKAESLFGVFFDILIKDFFGTLRSFELELDFFGTLRNFELELNFGENFGILLTILLGILLGSFFPTAFENLLRLLFALPRKEEELLEELPLMEETPLEELLEELPLKEDELLLPEEKLLLPPLPKPLPPPRPPPPLLSTVGVQMNKIIPIKVKKIAKRNRLFAIITLHMLFVANRFETSLTFNVSKLYEVNYIFIINMKF